MSYIHDTHTLFHFEQLDNGDYIIIIDSPLTFSVNGTTYKITPGYASNGMSVPRWLWSFISPRFHPKTLFPSIVHDYLYGHYIMCRREADRWYREALVECGYAEWKSWLVYYAVRIFGTTHWKCDCQ